MLRRAISLALCLFCCLNACSCGPSRGKQVRILKQQIPEVKQFIYDNSEFLQLLLDVKEKINEINEQVAEETGKLDAITDYQIYVWNDGIYYDAYGKDYFSRESFSPFTGTEYLLVQKILFGLYQSNNVASVSIYPDKIYFEFTCSVNTWLVLLNPVSDIEDPRKYSGRFEFTEKVNDDWCILIYNNT